MNAPQKAPIPALQTRGIVKRFPGVLALDHVDFDLRPGEIHALLGENGAGKTTLMNILYGLYQADEGEVYVDGKKVEIRSPRDSVNLGIGMIHQHFKLVDNLTVSENVVLGLKSSRGLLLDVDKAQERIRMISEKHGLNVDPCAKIEELSVGERQRVEIVKALYRDSRILILDEPTSVLTPSESNELMSVLRNLTKVLGGAVCFITHKLPEVMAVSDRATVLRRGKVVTTVDTRDVNEKRLAQEMVGREVISTVKRSEARPGEAVLEVRDLDALNDRGLPALKRVSFTIHQGEILGIAGVSGNGQTELAEVLMGLRRATGGGVYVLGNQMTNRPTAMILRHGVGQIPEDRLAVGVILNMSVAENCILGRESIAPFARNKLFLDLDEIDVHAKKCIEKFSIMTPNEDISARSLSGGNIQRLILARELTRELRVLIANNPTRGLDVAATQFVRDILIDQKEKVATLLISDDLDEVLMMSDRVAVMYRGAIVGMFSSHEASTDRIAPLMAGLAA